MEFQAGQVIVHPQHGPAKVTGFITRKVRGEERNFVRLQVIGSDLVVGFPTDQAEAVGVRSLLNNDQLRDIFDVLHESSGQQEIGWSRRIKDEINRFRSGNPLTIAGVVRDLVRRNHDKGLSHGEKSLMKEAKDTVVRELALCLDIDEEEADKVLESAILEGTRPDAIS